MWYKDLFEAYEGTYSVQDEIKSINANLNYVKNILEDGNFPSSIIFPSDVDALRDICYIKAEKNTSTLANDLYKSLMEKCIKFKNDYPNVSDDKFVDELTNIYDNYKTF